MKALFGPITRSCGFISIFPLLGGKIISFMETFFAVGLGFLLGFGVAFSAFLDEIPLRDFLNFRHEWRRESAKKFYNL